MVSVITQLCDTGLVHQSTKSSLIIYLSYEKLSQLYKKSAH